MITNEKIQFFTENGQLVKGVKNKANLNLRAFESAKQLKQDIIEAVNKMANSKSGNFDKKDFENLDKAASYIEQDTYSLQIKFNKMLVF